MARVPKEENHLQVFRGSRPRQDVFTQNMNDGCCPNGEASNYDKLAERTRFSNGLAHSNPIGANDKWSFRHNFSGEMGAIVQHINQYGVGAQIGVLAVPTYARVIGVAVHVAAEEEGLTFNLVTRNGLVLPADEIIQVEVAQSEDGSPCELERTQSEGSYEGFGELGDNLFLDIFGQSALGEFSLEADEIILEVATLPADGPVVGSFDIEVAVSYLVTKRAEA